MDSFDIIKYLAKNPLLQEDAEQEAFEKDEQYAFDLIGKLTSKIKSKEDIKKVINALHKGLFVNKNVDSLFDSSPGKDIANIFKDALEDIVPNSVINSIENDYKDVIQSIKDNDWEYFVGSEDEDEYEDEEYEEIDDPKNSKNLGTGSYSEKAALEKIDKFLKDKRKFQLGLADERSDDNPNWDITTGKYGKAELRDKTLDLNYSNIHNLPDNLKVVDGNLHLLYSKISRIPDNFTVKGDLKLRGENFKELGKNLKVGGDLELDTPNLKSLPSGLEVGGRLWIQGLDLEIPDDIKARAIVDY